MTDSAPLSSSRAASESAQVTPTVFVVDGRKSERASLRRLFESVALPVETYASAQEFLLACDSARPGCVVLELSLPDMSGVSLLEELAARGITLPVIMVATFADVTVAVRAMKAGAVSFLKRPLCNDLLLEDVRQALALDEALRRSDAERARVRRRLERLTPRERQVMRRIVTGMRNDGIAADLGISRHTVEIHRANVMHKARASSLAHLIRLAWLVAPEEF